MGNNVLECQIIRRATPSASKCGSGATRAPRSQEGGWEKGTPGRDAAPALGNRSGRSARLASASVPQSPTAQAAPRSSYSGYHSWRLALVAPTVTTCSIPPGAGPARRARDGFASRLLIRTAGSGAVGQWGSGQTVCVTRSTFLPVLAALHRAGVALHKGRYVRLSGSKNLPEKFFR